MVPIQFAHLLPGLPPVSIVTVVAFFVVVFSGTLYLLSRIPELLVITMIAFIYGAVPMLAVVKII